MEVYEDERFGISHTFDSFKENEVVQKMVRNIPHIYEDALEKEKGFEDLKTILDQYQEQPHLLDPHLEGLLSLLLAHIRNKETNTEGKLLSFKYLWLLIKVRGYKTIVRKMPHEVKDLLPVLGLLESPEFKEDFYSSYVLLMWISIIIYMPFNLMDFDVSSKPSQEGDSEKAMTIVDRILASVKLHLNASQGSREMAAQLASKFVTRPDLRDVYLQNFIDYCFEVLQNADEKDCQTIYRRMGVLRALGLIFKHGKREELLSYSIDVMSRFLKLKIHTAKDLLLRKLSVKLIQRLGLTFLKPKIAVWRYNRGCRSLSMNIVGQSLSNPESHKDDESEGDDDVPTEVEDVIDRLLLGLKDADTIVRWSSAKGIGRITNRLPRQYADEVVEAVLDLFCDEGVDKSWHGGCLALAELARRGLLLPARLPNVLPFLKQALVYDKLRGQCSVGSNVRDAACYLCWAFARAYHPEQMAPFVKELAQGLLIVALFDREIPCRRAASAAFQEHVGRQGAFPHGIEILTSVDYFAVGNRITAYTKLSSDIGAYKEYTRSLVDHLVSKKVGHWDSAIRTLAAKALHNLTLLDPAYVGDSVLPSLISDCTGTILVQRHGSILAVGYVYYALALKAFEKGECETHYVGSESLKGIYSIVSTLEERKLYKGMGGDYMRQATCVFIEKCALGKIPLQSNTKVLEEWHSLLELCIIHNEVSIREAARDAIHCMWAEYFTLSSQERLHWRDNLVKKYLAGLNGENEVHSLGYAAVFGCMPAGILKGKLDLIVEGLITATKVTPATLTWAQTRKESILAIVKIKNTAGLDVGDDPKQSFTKDSLLKVFTAFVRCLEDYTMDRRGDIGAWVREAAIQSLEDLVLDSLKNCKHCVTEEIVFEMVPMICRQAVERIDRTRKIAGTTFGKLLHSEIPLPYLPHSEEVGLIFSKEWCANANWAAESITFDKFVDLLDFDAYRQSLTLGLVYSLGGTSANLSRYTSLALQRYFNERVSKMHHLIDFMGAVSKIFEDNPKNDRVILPLVRSLSELLSSCSALDQILGEVDGLLTKLILHLKKESIRCSDYHKLSAIVSIFCELLRIETESTKVILSQLAIFLGYQYPKVRAHTAASILTALQDYGAERTIVPEENMAEICSILEETKWMEALEDARKYRNEFCKLANIPVPQIKKIGLPKDT